MGSINYRKTKGKSFENKVAEYIHNYFIFNNEEYRTLYTQLQNENIKPKRDFSSGNFNNSDGDIDLGILKKFFPFTIECKHWKNLNYNLNTILNNKISELYKIYKNQSLLQYKKTNLLPIIIFSGNYTSIFVFFDINLLQFNISNIPFYVKINNYIICKLDDFLKFFSKGN